jgi:hypothetical protein
MNVDPRSTSFLFEHHLIPGIRDEIKELSSFLRTTESFLDSLRRERLEEFISKERDLGGRIPPRRHFP